jgi:arginine decarboxylase
MAPSMVPIKLFFTKGVGVHKDYLTSFELALRDAGIAPFNLVTVSSIFPPGCKKITREEGLKYLSPGEIVFCVMARNATSEPNRLIAASVGCAIPSDPLQHGYLSEHHPFGETDAKTGEYAEDLAATMLATTTGIEFNPDTAWDEREQLYKASGKIIRTTNITQSALGNKDGLWTTVLSAAVFIMPELISSAAVATSKKEEIVENKNIIINNPLIKTNGNKPAEEKDKTV